MNKANSLSLNIGGRLQTRRKIGEDDASIFTNMNDANQMSGAGVVDGKYIIGNPNYVGVFDFDGIKNYYGKGYTTEPTNVLNLDLIYKLNLDALTQGLNFTLKGSYNSSYTQKKARTTWEVVTYLPNWKRRL